MVFLYLLTSCKGPFKINNEFIRLIIVIIIIVIVQDLIWDLFGDVSL